jgi:hypothetical protein
MSERASPPRREPMTMPVSVYAAALACAARSFSRFASQCQPAGSTTAAAMPVDCESSWALTVAGIKTRRYLTCDIICMQLPFPKKNLAMQLPCPHFHFLPCPSRLAKSPKICADWDGTVVRVDLRGKWVPPPVAYKYKQPRLKSLVGA